MEDKHFRLVIKFTEVSTSHSVDPSKLSLVVATSNSSTALNYQISTSIYLTSFSPDMVLSFSLQQEEALLAYATVPVSRLCTKTITGDFDRWLKMTPNEATEFEPTPKIKIAGSLRPANRKSLSRSRGSLQVSSPRKGKCSYLNKLTVAEDNEKEAKAQIVQAKQSLGKDFEAFLEEGIKSPSKSPSRSPAKSPKKSPVRRRTFEEPSFIAPPDDSVSFSSRFNLSIDQLSSQEPHLLRNVALGLCEKLRVLRSQTEEYENIQELLLGFDEPMQELEQAMKETEDQLTQEDTRINQIMDQLQKDNDNLQRELSEADKRKLELQEQIKNCKAEITTLQSQNNQLKEKTSFESTQNQLKQLKDSVKSTEETREAINQNYQKTFEEFSKVTEKTSAETGRALESVSENSNLLANLKAQIENLDIENLQLEAQVSAYKAQLTSEEDTRARLNTLQKGTSSIDQITKEAIEKITSLYGENDKNQVENSAVIRELEVSTKDLQNNISVVNSELAQKAELLEANQSNVEELKHNLSQISSMLAEDEHLKENFSAFQEESQKHSKLYQNLLQELFHFSDFMFVQAQEGLLESRLSKRLTEMIEERQYQKNSMQKMLFEAQMLKPAHVPYENDPLDLALSEYLHSRASASEISFLRLSKSTYLFGTLEVKLTKERGELFVHTADKKLPIEDFLEGYEEVEKEKVAEMLEKKSRASSPKKSPGRSPVSSPGKRYREYLNFSQLKQHYLK